MTNILLAIIYGITSGTIVEILFRIYDKYKQK